MYRLWVQGRKAETGLAGNAVDGECSSGRNLSGNRFEKQETAKVRRKQEAWKRDVEQSAGLEPETVDLVSC